jgi:hypothetical protein
VHLPSARKWPNARLIGRVAIEHEFCPCGSCVVSWGRGRCKQSPESGLATSQLYGHCVPVAMLCAFESACNKLQKALMPCTRRACKLQPKLTRSKLSLATPAAALFSQSVSGKVHMIGGCLEACRLECSLCTLMLQSLAAKLAV